MKHVYFYHQEEVDSLTMLKGCHEEAQMENNQHVFDLQVVVPKCPATGLNDKKLLIVHNDIDDDLIVMHENSFLNIRVAHDMVPPIEDFHEQSQPYLKNDVEIEDIK